MNPHLNFPAYLNQPQRIINTFTDTGCLNCFPNEEVNIHDPHPHHPHNGMDQPISSLPSVDYQGGRSPVPSSSPQGINSTHPRGMSSPNQALDLPTNSNSADPYNKEWWEQNLQQNLSSPTPNPSGPGLGLPSLPPPRNPTNPSLPAIPSHLPMYPPAGYANIQGHNNSQKTPTFDVTPPTLPTPSSLPSTTTQIPMVQPTHQYNPSTTPSANITPNPTTTPLPFNRSRNGSTSGPNSPFEFQVKPYASDTGERKSRNERVGEKG